MEVVQKVSGPAADELFTATTFLEYMRRSAPHWWDDSDAQDECVWVFRGHRNANWKLIPTAGRRREHLKPDFRNIVDSLEKKAYSLHPEWDKLISPRRELILRYWAVGGCIKRFLRLASDLGFTVEQPKASLSTARLVQKFESWAGVGDVRNAWDWSNDVQSLFGAVDKSDGFPYPALRSISLAQHHGIPTFLMDWTEDPIVACHFATTGQGHDIAVWALNYVEVDRLTPYHLNDLLPREIKQGIIRSYNPGRFGNEYLASQSGVFTTILDPGESWLRDGEFPALEKIFSAFEIENLRNHLDGKGHNNHFRQVVDQFEAADTPLLKKIILPADQVPELQLLLFREGISTAHLMPSLDNIAKTAMQYAV